MIWIGSTGGARFAAAATTAGAPRVPVSIDDLELAVARQVPAFGGMFLDSNRTLNIYLTETRQAAAAESAIASVFGRDRFDMTHARVLLAQYSFSDLKAWHDRHRLTTLAMPGVVLTEIHKATNRLLIGVESDRIIRSVATALVNAGIPVAAVEIVVMKPFEALDTLLDTHRPLLGGLKVTNDHNVSCTLGFLAVGLGKAGFVTCSHCTDAQGGVEGTIFHQATISGDLNRVGVEIADPLYFSGSGCPSGRMCRISDSAFVARNGGADQATPRAAGAFSHLALIDNPSFTIFGDLEVVGRAATPIDGELVSKLGVVSGVTDGQISATCSDINEVTGSNDKTILCQDQVTPTGSSSPAMPGDSGSPVFSESGTPLSDLAPATLYGLLWGGNGTAFGFSTLPQIEADLGALRVFPGDPGPNSPPEVKIRQPLAFAHVGVGGLNVVDFQADIVDYEGCCSDVTWTSDKDGVIGHGANLEFTFPSAGTRTITVTATDNLATGGATASDSLMITAGTSAPIVSILVPVVGLNIYQGVTTVLWGTSLDPNEPGFKMPCAALTWTSSAASDPFPVTGCNPQVAFQTVGPRTLTLTGTDSWGLTATATRTFSVMTQPATSAPAVTILNPLTDDLLDPSTVVTLTGKAQDPGVGPLTYQWVLIEGQGAGQTQTVLGTGSAVSGGSITLPWKPADNIGFHCGGELVMLRLDVTNASAKTGSLLVGVRVAYPTC
jgi:hypothetical protein